MVWQGCSSENESPAQVHIRVSGTDPPTPIKLAERDSGSIFQIYMSRQEAEN